MILLPQLFNLAFEKVISIDQITDSPRKGGCRRVVGKIEMPSKLSGKLRQVGDKCCVVLGKAYESRCYDLETLFAHTFSYIRQAYALAEEQAIAVWDRELTLEIPEGVGSSPD